MKTNKRYRHLRSSRYQGAALISVLSLLALLTVLALGALNATRRHAQLARTSFLLVQQRELADSALRLSILELATPKQTLSTTDLGQRSLELFGQTLTVDAQLEFGRIDLNYASELLLVAAFAGNKLSESEARSLAARIVDWRDADDTMSIRGAERNEYRRANRVGPRNGPFESVTELTLVLGAERLTEHVLDIFTVYSHIADVRDDAAVPAAMSALRWAHAQRLGGRAWLSEGPAASNGEQQRNLAGEVIRLRACTAARPLEICRVTIVRLTGDRSNPALVFSWN